MRKDISFATSATMEAFAGGTKEKYCFVFF